MLATFPAKALIRAAVAFAGEVEYSYSGHRFTAPWGGAAQADRDAVNWWPLLLVGYWTAKTTG
jgi:hypothetical protein